MSNLQSVLSSLDSQESQAIRKTIPGHSFTVRSVLAGLLVGVVICAANVYFGLQTGWVSIMSMPASLMGFGIFQMLKHHITFPFSPVENVLLQSVACGMAIMPLGCGLVGVIPAMEYLLDDKGLGSMHLSVWTLTIWSLGLCYFGVVFAVPLRRQVIVRERLRFPSGFSTAILISVLHSQSADHQPSEMQLEQAAQGDFASLVADERRAVTTIDNIPTTPPAEHGPDSQLATVDQVDNMRLLLLCFFGSGIFTISTYFFPIIRNLPIFGTVAARTWLWTFNPSLAYVGQGIIMGTETTLHMLLGALVGWGMLSPLAKLRGWAPGEVEDWEGGSKGWIVWVSLAIMLVDAVVGLAYVALRQLFGSQLATLHSKILGHLWIRSLLSSVHTYYPLAQDADQVSRVSYDGSEDSQRDDPPGVDAVADAPAEQRMTGRVVWIGLALSMCLCIATIRFVFGNLVPFYATLIAVLMALVLSIMGVRALGETDLNPVSGISKLAQLFFAFIIPQSNRSTVLINLVAGAVSEAGALQAGDLMQDLKTGHLLGASPKAQFWGQVIGASVGAVFSAFMYRLYTSVYTIPGDLFQVPTAYVWIFTARLVTGQGLPYMAKEWATGAGALFSAITIVRTCSAEKPWRPFLPGGIAVAIGMYNVPSFTLARSLGGAFAWYWTGYLKRPATPLIIVASGFILGEGFLSILNLIMHSLNVPHA